MHSLLFLNYNYGYLHRDYKGLPGRRNIDQLWWQIWLSLSIRLLYTWTYPTTQPTYLWYGAPIAGSDPVIWGASGTGGLLVKPAQWAAWVLGCLLQNDQEGQGPKRYHTSSNNGSAIWMDMWQDETDIVNVYTSPCGTWPFYAKQPIRRLQGSTTFGPSISG